jgi:uncharacterized protein HemX
LPPALSLHSAAQRRLKMRSSADIVGIIALILLVLIFLRVFGFI